MPMTLEEWDHGVAHHLRMIRTCAASIIAHADAMHARPDFETMAADELGMTRDVLAQSLADVQRAISIIREKPVDA